MKVISVIVLLMALSGCNCIGMSNQQRQDYERCKNVPVDHYQECAKGK